MYIVAIAWIYVVLMVSVMQSTVFRGIMTFIFTGLLPLALVLFLVGTPQRRRNKLAKSQVDLGEPNDEATAAPTASAEAAKNDLSKL